MYDLTLIACALCVIALIGGLQDGWPWWALAPLSVASVVFLLGGIGGED